METVLVHGIWAIVVAGLAVFITLRCERFARTRLEFVHQREQAEYEAKQAKQQVELQERQIAADLQQQTAETTADLQNAQNMRRAAEERAAGRIADDESLTAAEVEARKQVIAARVAARVKAAEEGRVYEGDRLFSEADLALACQTFSSFVEQLAVHEYDISFSEFRKFLRDFRTIKEAD